MYTVAKWYSASLIPQLQLDKEDSKFPNSPIWAPPRSSLEMLTDQIDTLCKICLTHRVDSSRYNTCWCAACVQWCCGDSVTLNFTRACIIPQTTQCCNYHYSSTVNWTLTSGGTPADSHHGMVEKPCPCVPLKHNTDLSISQCCHCADLCTTNDSSCNN